MRFLSAMVSQYVSPTINFLEVWYPLDHEMLSTAGHLGLHVGLVSIQISLGTQALV